MEKKQKARPRRVRRVLEEPAYSKGDGIFNPYLHNPHIVLVGAGGIGGWVGMQLAKMGVRKFTIWDDDLVARHNLSNTPYREQDRQKSKAHALARFMKAMNKEVQVKVVPKKYTGQKLGKPDVLISAVDSMAARKLLFDKAVEQEVPLFIDGRIGGENLRVYSLQPTLGADRKFYRDKSVWTKDENVPPLPCSIQQTIYIGNLVAARITKAVQLWETRREYVPELIETVISVPTLYTSGEVKRGKATRRTPRNHHRKAVE